MTPAVRGPELRSYDVTVYYREPSYELRTGVKADDYRGTFRVCALHRQAATAKALHEFGHWALLSNVGWVREVVRVECVEVQG